ncbi:hypothetical protein APUTEX25_003653 [Auxenochlorella protothecoides]|uniref:Transcription elongation factor n=1 Tax=Auxenochlorella protothecoides TaxID=3075 RepID=A0A1D2AFI9_AUXPR|nr:hypothetical protein APUTEX25_003653 [Auxenochlorella protothecoides]|eukprot:RMZ52510.1 hypothetical protein APUTEX25_003653 [Auxenochlorella protothecoides]
MAVETVRPMLDLVKSALDASKELEAHPSGPTEPALQALEALQARRVTAAQLASSQAGKLLRPLLKHASPAVSQAAASVIAAWKECVRREAEEGRGGSGDAPSEQPSSTARHPSAAAAGVPVKVEGAQRPAGAGAAAAAPSSLKRTAPGVGTCEPPGSTPASSRPAPKRPAVAATGCGGGSMATPAPVPSTGDKVRDLCRTTFAAALCLAVEELRAAPSPDEEACATPGALAVAMEEELRRQHGGVTEGYKAKFRSLSFNLKDRKNPDLRRKVLTGRIAPDLLVTLAPEALASDAQREENARIREKKLFDSAPSAAKQPTTDQFQCGKCRQRKTTYYQMQTRSADEPMTTFVTCLNCNNRWKFC